MKKAVKNFLTFLCVIACCPCCFPCYFCALRKRKRRRAPPTELDQWRGPKSPSDVHPLPSRKRKLTLPSGTERAQFESEQKLLPQNQSLLFVKLPLELRRQIWKEVVGGFDIYLGIVAQQLQHCKLFGVEHARDDQVRLQQEHKLLPLLLTCRQVYSEAIPYLYSANKFRTSHVDVVPALTSSLRLSRFDAITSMALSWSLPAIYRHTVFDVPTYEAQLWDRASSILASMKGLKDLHVLLWTCTPYGRTWQWQGLPDLLHLLSRVRPKSHYCLTIDEHEVEELTTQFSKAPFELHWK